MTDEASDTQVEYGTSTSYGSSSTLNSSKVTSHSATLSGLQPSTTYHFRVKSRDAAGNLATEDVVAMLHGMGIKTGIDLDKLTEASRTAATFVGHELPSKYLKAHIGKQARARRRAEAGR